MTYAPPGAPRTLTRITTAYDDTTPDYLPHFRKFEDFLAARFGGYARTCGQGGWRDNANGKIMHEPCVTYEVSYKPNNITSAAIIWQASKLGQALNQEWVHVTHAVEYADHVDCRAPKAPPTYARLIDADTGEYEYGTLSKDDSFVPRGTASSWEEADAKRSLIL